MAGPARSASFADRPWAAGHAAELDRMRDSAEVDLNEARLALGEHADLEARLRRQIAQRPHDERLRGQLIRACSGAGRATEASLAFREAFGDLGGGRARSLRALGEQARAGRRTARRAPRAPSPRATRAGAAAPCCAPTHLAGEHERADARPRH